MSDLSNAFKAARDFLAGKHPDDAAAQKIVSDLEDAIKVIAGAAKDAPALMADAIPTSVDFAKLVADALAKNFPGLIVDVPVALEQLAKDVADIKQAIADGKAAAAS